MSVSKNLLGAGAGEGTGTALKAEHQVSKAA
jgi:hypothetical protein